jgi:hypothetical protein
MSTTGYQAGKIVDADAEKYTKKADLSDDTIHGPPEHTLQRQLKNRHIAMIRFVETLRLLSVDSYCPANNIVLVVSLEPVRLRLSLRLALVDQWSFLSRSFCEICCKLYINCF